MKSLEKQWEREKAARVLKELVQATWKEFALDPSLGVAGAFGGGRPMFGLFGQGEAPPTARSSALRWAEGIAGGFVALAGLGIFGGGAFLVLTGWAEATTVAGSVLAAHQVPVGVFVSTVGLVIVGAGGYMVYDAITRP